MMKSLMICAVLFVAPVELHAQPSSAHSEDPAEQKKLDAWPKAENAKEQAKEIKRLRKANTEEMGVSATSALKAGGASAAPALLKALGKEKDKDALARITEVLEAITSAEHTRLLAKEMKNKSQRVRTWVLTRIAAFPDHALSKDAIAHLDALKKKGDKADPKEVFAAALCTLSTGEIAGLDVVFEVAKESWKRHSAAILIAANEVRGELATQVLGNHLANGDRKARVAALQLLAGCGDKVKAVPMIAPLLDETDNSIRIGAINALRGIVDGDPPLNKLPVFEAIERARKWKERMQ